MIAKVALKHKVNSDLVFDYNFDRTDKVELYSLVEVEFSFSKTVGVVVALADKSRLKCKSIIRKLSNGPVFTPRQFTLARTISEHFLAPFGPTLLSFLPQLSKYEYAKIEKGISTASANKNPDKNLIIGSYEQRLQYYFQKISPDRQNIIILPTIKKIKSAYAKISHLFPQTQIFSWHSRMSPARRRVIWQSCLDGQALTVLGTRDALFLPFTRLGAVVIDEPLSFSYFEEQLPRYNAYYVSRELSRLHHSTLIVGESIPSTTNYAAVKKGLLALRTLPYKPKIRIFDSLESEMSSPSRAKIFRKAFRSKNILVVGPFSQKHRLVCRDCQTEKSCNKCNSQIFIQNRCAHCTTPLTNLFCPKCQSKNIKRVGFSKVDIEKLFPLDLKNSFTFCDLDAVENEPPVYDFALVPYFDLQYNFPYISYKEKMVGLVFTLSQITLNGVLVFSQKNRQLLHELSCGNYQPFVETQLRERKNDRFPPFTRAVKVICKADLTKAKKIIDDLTNQLKLPKPAYIIEKKLKWTEALFFLDHSFFEKNKITLKQKTTANLYFIVDPVDFGL